MGTIEAEIKTNTKIIFGPPGTGKTTTLLNLVDKALSEGVEPNKIGFISFTKKSVEEARDRAAEKFEVPKDYFDYFRTIHSLCFRQLVMSRGQVMQKNHYQELGEILGVEMSGIHRQDQQVYEMPKGDQMVFLESLSRLKCEELSQTHHDANPDISIHQLDHFQDALKKYKKNEILYDFTDMLVEFEREGYAPDLDVLFVDEAQDLCRLQWNIVQKLSAKAQQVHIAGDDDQAIFRWSGADIDYFLALAHRSGTQVLDKSYRLPKKIWQFGLDLSKQIEDSYPKDFMHREGEGKVERVSDLDSVDMSKGQWLILVRNGFFIKDIVKHVRMMGYPYETVYYSINKDNSLQCAYIWENLRKGHIVTKGGAVRCLDLIKDPLKKANTLNSDINMKDLVALGFITKETSEKIWHEALDLISEEDRDYYIAMLRSGEKLTAQPRIKIGTIHGAKGGEADNVVLFTDVSYRIYKNMQENYDDELRVFYVGVTRAKENLYIVSPQGKTYFTL